MNLDQDRYYRWFETVRNQNVNQNGNGNIIAAQAEGNGNGNNGNRIRCYNYRGMGHLARNCTEEVGIQLQAKEFDLMAVAWDLNEIKEVNANCILMANLQQASTSGTQTNNALVYNSDGSAEVHHSGNCYDNDIFNMFTQEEQYTELLKTIFEPHQVSHNDSNVISAVSSVEQSGGTVEQNPTTVEETRAYFESLYNNLAIESVYQEQCLTKKINALHLSSAKTITTLNEEIANLNNQLSKEKSTVSFLHEEKKKLKSDFKTREDALLDKQIQPENKIKESDKIW
ncbi:gag-pol polyprotein [Tanacetum coccineum]